MLELQAFYIQLNQPNKYPQIKLLPYQLQSITRKNILVI